MSIMEQLDALREDFPNCVAVGLADISSGVVLCVSSAEKHPQERLDALCATAAELFAGEMARSSANLLAFEVSELQESLVLTESETCVFLRSELDPNDVMFCVCAPSIDVSVFSDTARSRLSRISAET